MTSHPASYHGYRFPPEIISHAVWLYYRFALSFRDAEDLLAQRGITVSYEAIRQWCQPFGLDYARRLRRRRGRMGDTWYLDELFVTIQGRQQYLWRAVDQDGDELCRTVLPSVVHVTDQYANNRAEVSHQPTRQRERQMRRFKSAAHVQRFASVHGRVQNLFRVGRHLVRAVHHRLLRTQAFGVWREVTCV